MLIVCYNDSTKQKKEVTTMIIEILAKLLHVEIAPISDEMPIPLSVDGKPVLIALKNKLIIGA